MRFLINVLISAVALGIAARVVPGIRIEGSIQAFLVVATAFGLVNAFVRPVVRLVSLPISLITLGLFGFVINAGMLMLTDWLAGAALSIEGGFLAQLVRAFAASIVISVASALIGWVVPGDD